MTSRRRPVRPGARGRPAGSRSGQPTPRRDLSASERGVGGQQVEGRHAVLELLAAGRRRVREVWVQEGQDPSPVLTSILDHCGRARIPVRRVGRGKLAAEARTEAPQGVLALADPLPEVDLDDLCAHHQGGRAPFLLGVDGVTDPGNLGTLLRSAVSAGATGVVLPRHRSAHVTPAVTKAAAGAIEHLRFAVVPGLPGALRRAGALGVWSVGLDAKASTSLWDLPVGPEPVLVVLGAEGRGLSRLTAARCDVLVRVPMAGPLDSLNVAAAGALALFEVARRRMVT